MDQVNGLVNIYGSDAVSLLCTSWMYRSVHASLATGLLMCRKTWTRSPRATVMATSAPTAGLCHHSCTSIKTQAARNSNRCGRDEKQHGHGWWTPCWSTPQSCTIIQKIKGIGGSLAELWIASSSNSLCPLHVGLEFVSLSDAPIAIDHDVWCQLNVITMSCMVHICTEHDVRVGFLCCLDCSVFSIDAEFTRV